MKYVARIQSPDGEDVNSTYHSINDEGYLYTVAENGQYKTEKSNLNCIGRGVSIHGHNVVAVCHNIKTAKLQDYVNMAETAVNCKPQSFRVRDYMKLSSGVVYNKATGNSKVLCVDTDTDVVKVVGESGSVVLRKVLTVSRPNIMTLYDLFVDLCKSCKMNIMFYETIQLCSIKRGYETLIRLIHNQESERFFLKMYLEASCHE